MYSAIVEIRVRHLESPHGKKKKKKLSVSCDKVRILLI